MTTDEARGWLDYRDECGGQLADEDHALVAEAQRVLAKASGAPWWEYEGIGPDEGGVHMTATQVNIERALRPTGENTYDVYLDGERVGRIWLKVDGKPEPWRGPDGYWWDARRIVDGEEVRTGHVYARREGAARGVVRSLGFSLRDKDVADLTDKELVLRWEAELHEAWYIAQGDAVGTAAKMGDYDHKFVKPVREEARKRGIEKPRIVVP